MSRIKPMQGQQTLFDLPKENPRPCDYRFQRFYGQVVVDRQGRVGRITNIEPYYTEYEVDRVSCSDCIQKRGGNKFMTCGSCWSPFSGKVVKADTQCIYWEKHPKLELRNTCERYCDVEWCSLSCFFKRGYIRDPKTQKWARDENGKILISKTKECDWVPKDGDENDEAMPGSES